MAIPPLVPRRFPSPWRTERVESGWRVHDANGLTLAYVFGRDDMDAKLGYYDLTVDEARRIARGIARLPELLAGDQLRVILERAKAEEAARRQPDRR